MSLVWRRRQRAGARREPDQEVEVGAGHAPGVTWTKDIVTLVQPRRSPTKSQAACCAMGVVATVAPSVPSSVYQ